MTPKKKKKATRSRKGIGAAHIECLVNLAVGVDPAHRILLRQILVENLKHFVSPSINHNQGEAQ